MNLEYRPEDVKGNRNLVTSNVREAPDRELVEVEGPSPLFQLYWLMFRRKWAILACITVALLIGATLTLLATPLFTATSTLEIAREVENVTGIEGVTEQVSAQDREFYQTQYGLLRSNSLARSVAEELNLAENPQFLEAYGLNESGSIFGRTPSGQMTPQERTLRLDQAERILLGSISVVPPQSSRLVELRFTSPDPQFSAQVVNAWVENFMQQSLDRRFGSASFARDFLERRLEQVRQRLEGAERQLVAYATQQGIVSINTGTGDENGRNEMSLTGNTLALLNSQLAQASADRILAQSRLQQAGGASQEALANPAISALRQRRAEAAGEYSRLLIDYEPGFPQARALQSQIQSLDRDIAREEGRVSSSIQQAYRAAVERENALQSRVAQLTGDVLNLRQRSIQYNIYQRDVDTSRSLYEGLLQRYKEIGIAGGVGRNNIAVVDAAKPPRFPSSPNLMLNMLLSLIFGIMAGLAAAFALEQIDEGISDPDEVASKLGLSLLGVVGKEKYPDLTDALADPKSSISEAYIAVRTALEFSSAHGAPRMIAVTSSRAAEGKTTSSIALATVLARLGKEVLLVDGDMRNPSLHGRLRLSNKQGLSNFLSGKANLDDVVQATDREGLRVVTSGPIPPNAAELLSAENLPAFTAAVMARFDYLIFDTPPVLGLADAPLIASAVEGVVFVIEARQTKKRVAGRAIARLRGARSHLLGGILTKFDPSQSYYGYGEAYEYKYGKSVDDAA